MKITILTLLILTSMFARDITIAIASNVSYAVNDLKQEFKKSNPDINVKVIFGSSGKLTAQINNGAPYGLLMSANMIYPNELFKNKIAITKPIVYARGALAYFSVKGVDFSKGIDVLKDDSVKKIAIANPKTAPYGKASVEALSSAGVYNAVKEKFVYAESISQAISYATRVADVALIAKSSLYSKQMLSYREYVNWLSVNPKLYAPIKQGIVLLKYSKNSKEYRTFYEFILSDRAKIIFKKYGYE